MQKSRIKLIYPDCMITARKEIEITESSEVCRKGQEVILGDHGLTFKFDTVEIAKEFRQFLDFRYVLIRSNLFRS